MEHIGLPWKVPSSKSCISPNYCANLLLWKKIFNKVFIYGASLEANLSAMWEIWVQSLGQEDTLKKEMAIHSSILAWRIPWTEEPGGLQSMGSKESDTT